MSFLISRLFVFAGLVLLSIIVLGVASAAQSTTPTASLGLSIATGIITILIVTVFLTLDRIRDGLVATKIITELVAFALLWILWVSSAGSMTSSTLNAMSSSIPISTPNATTTATPSNTTLSTRAHSNSTTSPSEYDTSGFCCQGCHLYPIVEAFSWLSWLGAFIWFWTLLVCTIIAARSSRTVWFLPVVEHPLFQGETDLEKLRHRREPSSEKIPQSAMVPAAHPSSLSEFGGSVGSGVRQRTQGSEGSAGRQSMFTDAAGPPGSPYYGYDPTPLPSSRNALVTHQHTGSGQSLLPGSFPSPPAPAVYYTDEHRAGYGPRPLPHSHSHSHSNSHMI